MSRLPALPPSSLDAEQAALYSLVAEGPRATGPRLFALTDSEGALTGPFNAMLLAPPVGTALQELGTAIRYRSTVSGRIREMAILTVAAGSGCAFEQYAHEPIGRAAGLSDAELAALRNRDDLVLDDPAEAASYRLVRLLVDRTALDDDTYTAVEAAIGRRAIFELTTLTGYYTLLALQLQVFDVGLPE